MKQKEAQKLYKKAVTLYSGGDFKKASATCESIIKSFQTFSQAHNLRGLIFQAEGEYAKSVACFRAALSGRMKDGVFYYNLGVSFLELKKYREAIEMFNHSLASSPDDLPCLANLGLAYHYSGENIQALETMHKAYQLEPKNVFVLNGLALVLGAIGEIDSALGFYSQTLAHDSNNAVALQNIGNLLNDSGRAAEALPFLRKAISVRPNYSLGYSNLGNSLTALGKVREAITCYRAAINYDRTNRTASSNLLLAMHYSDEVSPEEIYREHVINAESLLPDKPGIAPASKSYVSEQRSLRIGYVSGDFRQHSVAFFIKPLLESHNSEEFEIFCYSNTSKSDKLTETLRETVSADHWRDVYSLSDIDLVELIKNDEIDVLIDLSGHTNENRLSVFAHSPAPVQITYLGYPDTTGLKTIQYRLTDEYADPVGVTDQYCTEKLYRLPGGFLCYQPSGAPETVPPLPLEANGYITFGSFNVLSKITPQMFQTWSQILLGVPTSRLLLKSRCMDEEVEREIKEQFQQRGVDPARVDCLNFAPDLQSHLDLYGKVDIAVDTFPYNGTTTTFESLWMGRPVVSLAGETHVSRVGCSILSNLSFADLVVDSYEGYIAKCISLANNEQELVKFNRQVRSRMLASSLLDNKGFTHAFEAAIKRIYLEVDGQKEFLA